MKKSKNRLKKLVAAAVVISILLGIGLYVFYVYFDTEKGKYADDTEFGAWGQEVILIYEDGSTRQLNTLSVWDQNKRVSFFNYKLSAKATSTLYENIEIDLSEYEVYFRIYESAFEYVLDFNSGYTRTIATDGSWHIIIDETVSIVDIIDTSLPNGDYVLTVGPRGTASYSYGGTVFSDAEIPSIVTETFKIMNAPEYTLRIHYTIGCNWRPNTGSAYNFAQTFTVSEPFRLGKATLQLGQNYDDITSLKLVLRQDIPGLQGDIISTVNRDSAGMPSGWNNNALIDFVFDDMPMLSFGSYTLELSWESTSHEGVYWYVNRAGAYFGGQAYWRYGGEPNWHSDGKEDFSFQLWSVFI